jgi:hypothetical protein
MNGKKLTTTIIAVLLIVVVALVVLKLPGRNKDQTSSDQQTTSMNEDSMMTESQVVELMASSAEWMANNQYEFEVAYNALPDPIPAAETLQFTYDPAVIQVDDVEEGNLWTNTNVLQKDIDNDVGTVVYSAGQGFDADTTGNKVLATVKVTVLGSASGNTEIMLGPDSAVAAVGVDHLIPLNETSISINVK